MRNNALIFLMMILFLGASHASAFEATITNQTDHRVFVDGYGVAPGTDHSELAMTIGLNPKETLSLDFMHYVPSGLTGRIYVENTRQRGWLQIRPVTIQGGDTDGISNFTPLPGNTSWYICWKVGIVALPIKDNQYSFCKM